MNDYTHYLDIRTIGSIWVTQKESSINRIAGDYVIVLNVIRATYEDGVNIDYECLTSDGMIRLINDHHFKNRMMKL